MVDSVDEEMAFQQLKQIFPTAGILTKDDSDTDTASEDDELPSVSLYTFIDKKLIIFCQFSEEIKFQHHF